MDDHTAVELHGDEAMSESAALEWEPRNPAEELRLEIAERGIRAYQRALMLRNCVVAATVLLSALEGACALAGGGLLGKAAGGTAAVWGISVALTFFAASNLMLSGMYRDGCVQVCAEYLRKQGRLP